MADDAVLEREFNCVVEGCQESLTVDNAERWFGVVITYQSFFPAYVDVYAWCCKHIPETKSDELKEAVRTGKIEWEPSVRETHE